MEQVIESLENKLLNLQDMPPAVLKGCSQDEMLLIAGSTILPGMFIGLVISFITSSNFVLGVGGGMLVGLSVSWKAIGMLGKAKVGKPNGWAFVKARMFFRRYFGIDGSFPTYDSGFSVFRELGKKVRNDK